MSIRWNLPRIISLAVTSYLVCAGPAGAADMESSKTFVTSDPGMGGLAGPPSEEAREPGIAVAAADPAAPPATSQIGDYFANWFARVDQAKQSQPHWLPPLMTMSPLITELLRQDAYYQWAGNGSRVLNLGAGKACFWSRGRRLKWTSVSRPFSNDTTSSQLPAFLIGNSCWSSRDCSVRTSRKATTL